MFNHLKKLNVDFYLICKKSNRRLLFNDAVCFFFFFIICQYTGGEKWLQGRWRPCIFAKYNLFILYVHKKNPIFLYNFCQKWLDTLHKMTISFLFRLHFFKTFFAVSKPKATNSRVSDCYLTPTQQFSLYHGEIKLIFNEMMSILY